MVPKIGTLFLKLEKIIHIFFFGKLFGEEISTHFRSWASVTIKKGGTTFPKPDEIVDLNYQSSPCECSH